MKKIILIALSFLLLLGTTACGSSSQKASSQKAKQTEIHISIAASLKDVADKVKPLYEKKHPNTKLVFDFGGSGQIRERVNSGAPIDGVLFASESDLDKLASKNLAEDKQKFAENELVLIEPKTKDAGKKAPLVDKLNQADKVAIGDPESAPAGKYAEQTLKKLNIYDKLGDKLVKGSDVRQVLAYVASGNADAGFVYRTDAYISKKVQITAQVNNKLHDPIGYYSGVITDSKHKKQTKSFLNFLTTKEAQKVFIKYGFKVN